MPQNWAEALRLFTAAADRGDVDARYELGRCFMQGHGVDVDAQRARAHFEAAAAAGHVAAMCARKRCGDATHNATQRTAGQHTKRGLHDPARLARHGTASEA